MPNVDGMVQEAIAAIKAGRKEDAKNLLMKAVDLDQANEQAWLWLSGCVDTPEEQQICLENVLAINPSNQKARKGLDAILKKTGGQPTPPAPAAPASGDPFGGYDSNPFAGTGFDSNPYATSGSDPALGAGWDTFDSGSSADPFATPSSSTSADWDHGGGGAAHGSGKDVALPSSDEYDSWVSGLSLGGTADAGASSGGFDVTSGPFGSSSFDDSGDPFSNSISGDPFKKGAAGPSPFDAPIEEADAGNSFDFGGASASPFGNDPFGGSSDTGASDPFGSAGSDPFAGPFGSGSKSDSFGGSDPFASSSASSSAFGGAKSDPFASKSDPFAASSSSAFGGAKSDPFGGNSDIFGNVPGGARPKAEDPVADIFADLPVPKSAAKSTVKSDPFGGSMSSSPFTGSSMSPTMQAYFRAIPDEIQAPAGGKLDIKMIATLGVLTLLNAVSLALLVVNLMPKR